MSDLIYTNGNGLRMFLNTAGSKALYMKYIDPYNPLDLPDRTIRIQTSQALSIDDFNKPEYYANLTLVDNVQHIYDFQVRSWYNLFLPRYIFDRTDSWLISVIGANASSVGNMAGMFMECTNLQDVALFDTSSLKEMSQMFEDCTHLTYIPPFNVSQVEYAGATFKNCVNVERGILSMYNALSTNGHLGGVLGHYETFYNCGSNTVQGAAELAQIPSDWK